MLAPRSQTTSGLLYGVTAYAMWGVFPLFWPLLKAASAFEILSHRVLWSVLSMAALVVVTRQQQALRATTQKERLLLCLASLLVGFNWWLYIWAVNHGQVVETALGYFINPLVSVLFGVALLGERLRALQWTAVGLATFGVAFLTIQLGRPPMIAFALALSFGLYGLIKKKAAVAAVPALFIETVCLSPLAALFLARLTTQGQGSFLNAGVMHSALLVSTGLITIGPLLAFAASVSRVPLSTVGLLQYIAPSIQFCIGVFVRKEAMSAGRWAGFGIVWLALAVFAIDLYRNAQRR
jgi:chloramphenicol-sensitive protein RarD